MKSNLCNLCATLFISTRGSRSRFSGSCQPANVSAPGSRDPAPLPLGNRSRLWGLPASQRADVHQHRTLRPRTHSTALQSTDYARHPCLDSPSDLHPSAICLTLIRIFLNSKKKPEAMGCKSVAPFLPPKFSFFERSGL